ncbi:hypothetical protein ACQ4PT_031052 [Festuca glaucescens]
MDALAYLDLPGDVLMAILVRLPARSIARCREVCRAWRSAISHPSFDIAHAQRPAAVVEVTADQCYDYDLDIEYGALGPTSFTRTTVVLELFRGRWHRDIKPTVVVDPVSHPQVQLVFGPRFLGRGGVHRGPFQHGGVVQGSSLPPGRPVRAPEPGHNGLRHRLSAISHPSTRRFHLVHASGKTVGDHLMAPTTFRILRVGDAVWREIPLKEEENSTYESKIFMARHQARCVRSHGNLHWLVLWGSGSTLRLLTFDMTREKFRLLEAPPSPDGGRDQRTTS